MGLFDFGRKKTTTTYTGFLQSDVTKLMRQGLSLSSQNMRAPDPISQRSLTVTRESGGFGAALRGSAIGALVGGLTGGAGAMIGSNYGFVKGFQEGDNQVTTTGPSRNLFANVSQEQIDRLIKNFTARAESIADRTRAPGRERLFIRER